MRTIQPGEAVQAYWNFHKKCFSIQARGGTDRGRVIAHVDWFVLTDVNFVVRKAGQRRVRQEGKKNVHAFVSGLWAGTLDGKDFQMVHYNPFASDTFVTANGEAILKSPVVVGDNLNRRATLFAEIA